MMDRVTVFGDGVYDAAMGRNGKIFALPEHIDRIFNGMAKLKINPPCSKQEMADTLLEMLGKVDESEVFVYWQVTRGTARRAHAFGVDMKSNYWIMIFPDKVDPMNREFTAITHEDTRFLHCDIKTLNLIPSVMYAQAAKEAGVDEAILLRKLPRPAPHALPLTEASPENAPFHWGAFLRYKLLSWEDNQLSKE